MLERNCFIYILTSSQSFRLMFVNGNNWKSSHWRRADVLLPFVTDKNKKSNWDNHLILGEISFEWNIGFECRAWVDKSEQCCVRCSLAWFSRSSGDKRLRRSRNDSVTSACRANRLISGELDISLVGSTMLFSYPLGKGSPQSAAISNR